DVVPRRRKTSRQADRGQDRQRGFKRHEGSSSRSRVRGHAGDGYRYRERVRGSSWEGRRVRAASWDSWCNSSRFVTGAAGYGGRTAAATHSPQRGLRDSGADTELRSGFKR
ncbi:hypothetical protein A2U01_0048059, partial [Trifolium medium]|nr:hypothetical protein [Trifolium medium]